jgi:hypothetical protein
MPSYNLFTSIVPFLSQLIPENVVIMRTEGFGNKTGNRVFNVGTSTAAATILSSQHSQGCACFAPE